MPSRTITIDGAQLNEVRVFVNGLGQTSVQLSYTLLSGKTAVQQVSLRDFAAQLQPTELAAARALITTMEGALSRVEL